MIEHDPRKIYWSEPLQHCINCRFRL